MGFFTNEQDEIVYDSPYYEDNIQYGINQQHQQQLPYSQYGGNQQPQQQHSQEQQNQHQHEIQQYWNNQQDVYNTHIQNKSQDNYLTQNPIFDYQNDQQFYPDLPPEYYQQQQQHQQQGMQQGQYNEEFEPEPEVDESSRIDLNQFDPNVLHTQAKILFLGATKMGKSTVFLDFLHFLQDKIKAVSVSSTTEEGNHFYEKECNIPLEFINYALDMNQLERAFFRQKAWASGGPPEGFSIKDMNCFFIWDDCMEDTSMFNHPLVKRVFYNGRHWDTGLAMMVQNFVDIPKRIRGQFDYIVVCKETLPKMRRALWEMFFGMFETYAEFLAYFNYYTDNFGVLVIDVKSASSNLRDKIFWYKADPQRAKQKKIYSNSTMHVFHEYHYKVPTAASMPVNWKKVQGVSDLPEADLGMVNKNGKRVGTVSNKMVKSPLTYNFTLRDTQGKPLII